MIAFLKRLEGSRQAAAILRVLLLLGIGVLTGMAVGERKQRQFMSVQIQLEQGEREQLIDRAYISDLLAHEYGGDLVGVPISYVDVEELEDLLRQDAFVAHAEAFVDADMNLHLDIDARQPIARLDDGTVRYYVDETGASMPMSQHYSARVPIVHLPPNGIEFLTPERRGALITLLEGIRGDAFMHSLVDQIVVDGLNQYFFIPHMGEERIKFGDVKGLQDKFENIKVFYKKKMSQGYWGKCKWIDARYAGQIVCDLNKLENT